MLLFDMASCKKDKNDIPQVITVNVCDITSSSARALIRVSDDGGETVTGVGICWATSPNPDISGNVVNVGGGIGDFTAIVTGLQPKTSYNIRAFATNSVGTGYGENITFVTLN